MIQNYGLLSESMAYKKSSEPIFEAAIDDFIRKTNQQELEKAIRTFADSTRPEYKDGGVISINGKKVSVTFKQHDKEAGAYYAVFQFVDNPNAASDLAEALRSAIAGLGTDEDTIYAVAAAYRSYCQETGKDEFVEMYNIRKQYSIKYKANLEKDLADELVDDTFTNEEFNLFFKGIYLMGGRADTGEPRSKRIIDYTKPDYAVRMLNVDINHNNSIEFILGCPLKFLRPINDASKKLNNKSLYELVKSSTFSSDVKDLVKYYLMGAGILKKDDKFNAAYKIASEGKKTGDPAYSIDGAFMM